METGGRCMSWGECEVFIRQPRVLEMITDMKRRWVDLTEKGSRMDIEM